jgi:hypothetical protein
VGIASFHEDVYQVVQACKHSISMSDRAHTRKESARASARVYEVLYAISYMYARASTRKRTSIVVLVGNNTAIFFSRLPRPGPPVIGGIFYQQFGTFADKPVTQKSSHFSALYI